MYVVPVLLSSGVAQHAGPARGLLFVVANAAVQYVGLFDNEHISLVSNVPEPELQHLSETWLPVWTPTPVPSAKRIHSAMRRKYLYLDRS